MAFNIAEFRSTLVDDGARSSLFDVELGFPSVVATGGGPQGIGTAGPSLIFKAKSTALPGDSISTISVNYFGREIKVAGNRSFPEWTIQIINDETFNIRNAFERWMSGLNSHISNLRAPSMRAGSTVGGITSGYQTDGIIRQYSKTGMIVKQYRIIGCFPTDVSAIDLDWGSDQIEEFSVTLAYQWWESDTTEPLIEIA